MFACCASSLNKYLFRCFVHFLPRLFAFVLLSFKSSLYVIDVSPRSDILLTSVHII